MEKSPPPTQYTPQPKLQRFCSPPEPGLNQRSCSDHELEEDLINFELLSEQEDNSDHDRCLFIVNEAEESDQRESILNIALPRKCFLSKTLLMRQEKNKKAGQAQIWTRTAFLILQKK